MTETTTGTRGRVHRAGAFDIRNFIGALIGLYGVVLVIYGIVGSSAAQLKKSDQVNINLWAGIGMIIVAAVFLTWARLRPVVVPDHIEDQDGPPAH
jgi:drug/metabolite transporter (DMT)-like permease